MLRWFHVEPQGINPCAIPSGWRYLHDEIPNGIYAWSKLIVKASYTGDCVKIPSNGADFGFCQAQTDLASINAVTLINRSATIYDQVGIADAPTRDLFSNSYLFAQQDYGYETHQFVSGTVPINWDTPFTFIYCYNRTGAPPAFGGIMIGVSGTPGDSRMWLREEDDGKLSLFLRNSIGQTSQIKTTTSLSNGQNICALTYDGNPNMTGVSIYFSDLSTPKPTTIISTAVTGTFVPDGISFNGRLNNNAQRIVGRGDESHVFSGVMSAVDLIKAKEILEQRYIFI